MNKKEKTARPTGTDGTVNLKELLKAASPLLEFLQDVGGEDAVAIIHGHTCEVLTSVGAVKINYRIPEKYRTRCSRCGKTVDSRQNYCSSCGEWVSSNS